MSLTQVVRHFEGQGLKVTRSPRIRGATGTEHTPSLLCVGVGDAWALVFERETEVRGQDVVDAAVAARDCDAIAVVTSPAGFSAAAERWAARLGVTLLDWRAVEASSLEAARLTEAALAESAQVPEVEAPAVPETPAAPDADAAFAPEAAVEALVAEAPTHEDHFADDMLAFMDASADAPEPEPVAEEAPQGPTRADLLAALADAFGRSPLFAPPATVVADVVLPELDAVVEPEPTSAMEVTAAPEAVLEAEPEPAAVEAVAEPIEEVLVELDARGFFALTDLQCELAEDAFLLPPEPEVAHVDDVLATVDLAFAELPLTPAPAPEAVPEAEAPPAAPAPTLDEMVAEIDAAIAAMVTDVADVADVADTPAELEAAPEPEPAPESAPEPTPMVAEVLAADEPAPEAEPVAAPASDVEAESPFEAFPWPDAFEAAAPPAAEDAVADVEPAPFPETFPTEAVALDAVAEDAVEPVAHSDDGADALPWSLPDVAADAVEAADAPAEPAEPAPTAEEGAPAPRGPLPWAIPMKATEDAPALPWDLPRTDAEVVEDPAARLAMQSFAVDESASRLDALRASLDAGGASTFGEHADVDERGRSLWLKRLAAAEDPLEAEIARAR